MTNSFYTLKMSEVWKLSSHTHLMKLQKTHNQNLQGVTDKPLSRQISLGKTSFANNLKLSISEHSRLKELHF